MGMEMIKFIINIDKIHCYVDMELSVTLKYWILCVKHNINRTSN